MRKTTGPKRISAFFYRTPNGKEPVREWLISLAKDDKRVIGEDIRTVEIGWPVGLPVCGPLGRGLFEVRSNLSGGRIARVLFTIKGPLMLLLHGFFKTTEKLPKKDENLARARAKDASERQRKGRDNEV